MRSSVAMRSKPVRKLPLSLEVERPTLSRTDQDRVGETLRLMYGHLQEEPLSPKLQDLVHRLTQTPAE